MKPQTGILLWLCLLLNCTSGSEVFAQTKIINVAQQGPDTRLLKNNYLVWERQLPFNGLSINFNINEVNDNNSIGFFGKQKEELCYAVFKSKNTIVYDKYSNAINDLRACTFQKFKNNFLVLSMFDVNWSLWEDDLAWSRMLANLQVAAKIANESGLKGIILDTETYGSPQNLNLMFYCQQFANKLLIKDSKVAYIRLKDVRDYNSIDDLFPKVNDLIYWKDSSDHANGIKLKKSVFNIYTDDQNNYYYPLLDPKFKTDVQLVISSVEKRGNEVVQAISGGFPNAEIMLTIGPSYVKNVLSELYGLTSTSNYLRTGYGLLIPFTKGLLKRVASSNVLLIDGQEQSYFYKTSKQFAKLQNDFLLTGSYFGDAKADYLNKINMAAGLFLRPDNGQANNNPRLFSNSEVTNTFKFALGLKRLKYIWVYEENESYWFKPALKNQYIERKESMSKIAGSNFDEFINSINKGIGAIK